MASIATSQPFVHLKIYAYRKHVSDKEILISPLCCTGLLIGDLWLIFRHLHHIPHRPASSVATTMQLTVVLSFECPASD